jgi:hypothetical protein
MSDQSAGTGVRPRPQLAVKQLHTVSDEVAARVRDLAKAPSPKTMPLAPAGVAAAKPVQPGSERWPVKTGVDDDVGRVGTLDFAGVNSEGIVPTTVEQLIELPRPDDMTDIRGFQPDYQNRRAEPVELVIWKVDADITVIKKEGDGDLHMVLQGISGDTMIAEVPKPDRAFVAEDSPWFDAIKQVRGKIADRFGQTFAQTPFTQLNAKFAMPAASLTGAPAVPPAAPAGGPAAPLLVEPPGGDVFDALPPFKAQVPQTPVTITGVGFFDRVHDQTGVAMKNGIELHPVLAIEFR